MSDEAKKPENGGEWQMPEPVFRSSEGHTPRSVPDDDLPTDPGFDDEAPTETADRSDDDIQQPQTVRASSKTKVRHQKKKKRGCLKSVALTIVVLVLSVVLIIGTVIYFLFYSGPRGPF